MANNIVALNLNGNEYNFRPLYIVDGYESIGASEAVQLGYFSIVDGASLLVYLSRKDSSMDSPPVQFEVSDDSTTISAFYHGRDLYWSDLKEGHVYEFIFSDGSFILTGDIPRTSIKYRDNKNQLQTLVIGENKDIDLTGGVYYATTSSTATRVANSLILTDAGGNVCEYNGARPIDLSAGVNYAEHSAFADEAGTATSASQLIPYLPPIPGEHITGEYCHIASVRVWPGASDNYSMLFTGYGYNGLRDAPWSGILYFEWNTQSDGDVSASAKWLCLTRSELSNKIILTLQSTPSNEKTLHIYFAYPDTYVSANVTLIMGSGLTFDNSVSSLRTGIPIATSTFEGGSSSAGNLSYQILNDSGRVVLRTSVNLVNDVFNFRPGPNIIIESSHLLDSAHKKGITIQLSNEFTQAFVQLQQYTQILQHTVANQQQQIADLKSVLTEITTGKTWDDSIWGETAGQGATRGVITDEYGHIDIQPL